MHSGSAETEEVPVMSISNNHLRSMKHTGGNRERLVTQYHRIDFINICWKLNIAKRIYLIILQAYGTLQKLVFKKVAHRHKTLISQGEIVKRNRFLEKKYKNKSWSEINLKSNNKNYVSFKKHNLWLMSEILLTINKIQGIKIINFQQKSQSLRIKESEIILVTGSGNYQATCIPSGARLK